MAAIGNGVSLRGLYDTKYNHTLNLSGTIVAADVSKAVSQDITAANTGKLAADGDRIIGALFSIENRLIEGLKVGTVSRKGYFEFTYTGANPSIGHGIVGAGAGAVKGTTAAAVPGQPAVWSVDTVAKTLVAEVGL